MSVAMRRLVALGAVVAALGATAAPAWGVGGGDPLFTFVPAGGGTPAPSGYFIGPCGLGVDSSGNFYVSDYYHHAIDVYSGSADYSGPGVTGATGYIAQLANEDPLDGPCGLALDSTNRLYVNNFDRNVVRFNAQPSFGTGATIAGVGADSTHPSGVAVDPATNNVYVDARTYITGYDSSGVQLTDGLSNPLKIGEGTLGEGYGLAIDVSGRLYVADASDDTVKVYDPAISKTTPVTTIAGPPGGFSSLRHAALAMDRANGVLYVVDNLQPQYAEEPAAQVDVFNPSLSPPNDYLGVLKYEIADALPAGLAVNQSNGRVYVTSGNTDQAGIYAYAADSQIGSSQPPAVGLTVSAAGSGGGAVTSSLGGLDCSATCAADIRSGADVALAATPDPGSSFAGWSGGGCSGTGECTVTMDQAKSVEAKFEATEGVDLPAGGGAEPTGMAPISTSFQGPPAPAPARSFHPKRPGHHGKRRHRHHRKHHRVKHRQTTCKSGCRSP